MTKEELKKLIDQSEGHNLELKTSTSLKQEIGEAVSAFANTDGGIILVGVSPDGEIIGVTIGKKTLEDLANGIKENTDPKIYPQMKIHKVDGKNLIEIIVKEADEKPVFFQGHAYQRVGRTSPKISVSGIRELAKQERKTLTWDEKICEEAELKDIDENRVRWFLKKAKAERNLDIDPDTPAIEALERLEFSRNGRLTNASILLFGKNPQKFFLMAETRCGRFKGTEPVKPFIDMKVFGGSIIDQVDNAEDFVLRNTSMAVWVEKGNIERTEKWEYPPDAIREAIINAICHRDYEISSNVQIRVFDDRIEVWGCGLLPSPLTVEALMEEHKSILRNPLIGKCFFLIKFIEHWGTGTNDIIKDCLAMGLPEPIFKYVTNDLVITFRKYPILEDIERLGLNERQRKAIEFLRQHDKLTFSEYRKIYPDVAERTLRKDLEGLVKAELVKPTGEKKGRKYYLK